MNYNEFLETNDLPDCKLSWVRWKTNCCNMTLHEAIEAVEIEWYK